MFFNQFSHFKRSSWSMAGLFFLLLLAPHCTKEDPGQRSYREGQALRQKNDLKSLAQSVEKYHRAFNYAIESISGEFKALKFMAYLLSQEGYYLRCVKVSEEANRIYQQDPELYYYWGMCLSQWAIQNTGLADLNSNDQKDLNKAEKIYQIGLKIDPYDSQLNYGIGMLYAFTLSDQTLIGLKHLKRAYREDAQNSKILFALAEVYFKLNDHAQSRSYLKIIIDHPAFSSLVKEKAQKKLDQLNSFPLK